MSHGQIQIGVVGRIVDASESRMFVRVDDDSLNTGGFLILEGQFDPTTGLHVEGSDNWVQSMEGLEAFFKHRKWQVDWSWGERAKLQGNVIRNA